jgi:hypothetical protein
VAVLRKEAEGGGGGDCEVVAMLEIIDAFSVCSERI